MRESWVEVPVWGNSSTALRDETWSRSWRTNRNLPNRGKAKCQGTGKQTRMQYLGMAYSVSLTGEGQWLREGGRSQGGLGRWSHAVCSVAQSCPTLCNPMDCSLPGSSIHGTFQVRILESVAIFYSWASSQPRDPICISCFFCITKLILYHCTAWKPREGV